MTTVVNLYYKYLGEIEQEVLIYLETATQVVSHEFEKLEVDTIMNVLAIDKINDELHNSNRIKFMCNLFKNELFSISVKNSMISSAIQNNNKISPERVDSDSLFASSFEG